MYKNQHWWLRLSLILWDCVVSISAFLLAGIWRFKTFASFFRATNAGELMVVIVLSSIVSFMLSQMYNNFITRGHARELLAVAKYDFFFLSILLLYTFSTKNAMELSRLTLFYTIPISTLLLIASHTLIKRLSLAHAKGKQGWKLLILADEENVYQTCVKVNGSNGWKNKAIGVIVMDHREVDAGRLCGIPLFESNIGCVEYVRQNPVDEVLLSMNGDRVNTPEINAMINELSMAGVIVSIRIQLPEMEKPNVSRITDIGSFYVLSVAKKDYDFFALCFKRFMDVIGSVLGMAVMLLVGLFVAPAILIQSPGPVFFKQKRVGRNGRIFTMYKFRSMYRDAEARKAALLEQNQMKGLLFKIDNDPRITRVGKFIRKTSIDELPQFINVFMGDMSLVGTRPPTVDEYEKYSPFHKRRLSFRPGITGIWQTSGRNDITDFDEVIKMDLRYIQDWSLSLDLVLLMRTLKVVLLRKGAQ